LTTVTTAVDAPRTVMWSVSQIAERDGVSRQAVSKKVKTLVERHGLTVERDGQGRIQAVNVAEYDHLSGRYGDPSKAQAPRKNEAQDLPKSESYDEALRQKTWHEAERRRIELDELKKRLVRVDALLDAIARVGEDIVRVIDRLPNATDDLAAAVAREGAHGLRVGLKNVAARMRQDVAQALAALAESAPATDEAPSAPEHAP